MYLDRLRLTIKNFKEKIAILEGQLIRNDDDLIFSQLEDEFFALKALEKQLPKKVIEDGYCNESAICPVCGEPVFFIDDYHVQHCIFCGQKLEFFTQNE